MSGYKNKEIDPQNKKETSAAPLIVKQSDDIGRSDEVNDIIERMPTYWTKWITLIVTINVILLLTFSFIVEYPDSITGPISISGKKAPVRLISHNAGRLHLLVDNHTIVTNNEILGYIENGAELNDVILLDRMCSSSDAITAVADLPKKLRLGELSGYYYDFINSYNLYQQILNTKVYLNSCRSLNSQIEANKSIAENMNKELKLNDIILHNIHKDYSADSILEQLGAISTQNLVAHKNNVMLQEKTNIEFYNNYLSIKQDIKSHRLEIEKNKTSWKEEIQTAYNTMLSKYNILFNELRIWKERYLFISPIAGEVEFLGFWRENVFITTAREVFSVAPTDNTIIGDLEVSAIGAGKIEVGQTVNVKLYNYPYTQYGYIVGRVASVSTLPHLVAGANLTEYAYLVSVEFPDSFITNYGVPINLNYETKGTGDIITTPHKLIERLFDNIKVKTIK